MKPKITTTKIVHATRLAGRTRRPTATKEEEACTAGPHGCTKTRCHCARKDRAVRGDKGQPNRNPDTQ